MGRIANWGVDMRITAVRAHLHRQTYDGGVGNTHHRWTERNYLLVSVSIDKGWFGLGEAYADHTVSPAAAAAILREEIAPHLIDRDPRDIGRHRARLGARQVLSGRAGGLAPLLSAVDIALWDLLGKIAGLPLHRLLGGFADRATVYGSGGMYGADVTLARLAEEARAAVSRGMAGVKIKGAGASIEEDVARVAAVRDALGPGRPLMVDAMFAPSASGAIRLARALMPFDLHFLEAPTAAADVEAWARLAGLGLVPLAGPELESDVDLMRRHLVSGAAQFLQYDVTIAGGLSGGRDLAALAAAVHRPVTLHCATSAIGLAASAHLAAALPNADGVEYHLLHQGLHDRLWSSGWRLADGALVAPDKPGLGLDIHPDELADPEAT